MYGVGQPQVPPKPDPTVSTELGVDHSHKHTSRLSEAGFESVASPNPTATGTVVYSDAGTSGAQEAGSRAVYEMHCAYTLLLLTQTRLC